MPTTTVKPKMEITTVQRAHTKYTGLRTPIPATYARDLELKPGDKLEWESTTHGEIRVLIIRKAKKEADKSE